MLTIIGNVSASTGYGLQTRNLILGLYRIGAKYKVIHAGRFNAALDIGDEETREAIDKGLKEDKSTGYRVFSTVPSLVEQVDDKTVFWFPWETDILPEFPERRDIRPELRSVADAARRGKVVATCEWLVDIYKNHNLNVVGYVYPPVNQKIFKPIPSDNDKFTVLILGKLEPRKRIYETLIWAMVALAGKQARIILKTSGNGIVDTIKKIKSRRELQRLKLPEVALYEQKLSDKEIALLHQNADLTLMLTHGEGFGYPAAQAVFCKQPVLCTDGSALPEVVGQNPELLVKASLAPILFSGYELFYAPMKWYYPDIEESINKIENFYNIWAAGKPYDMTDTYEYGLQNYTPEASAKKMLEVLNA